jgi:hypothetical protein
MTYDVTIDFKRGPSLGINVYAVCELAAKEAAKREAPLYGFTDPIKSVTVRAAGANN